MDYIAYLHKDRKSDFGVSFPDFPGCVTAGRTLEEARRKAEEALALHIQGMAEDGDAIPKPSKLDEITDDPDRKGAVAILVNANLEKTVRVNITARESQIAKIDRLAEQAGMSRSAYIVRSAIQEEKHIAGARTAIASNAGAGRNRAETRVLQKGKRSRRRSVSH
jgi:predicted RNase H-like HicB family nuclease